MKPVCTFLLNTLLLCSFAITAFTGSAQEICNNGKDDDGDGLADLFDPDCQCRFNVTDNLLLNGSFEEYDHCPVNYTYDKDSNIADHWLFGTCNNINEAYYYHNLTCAYDSGEVMINMPPALPLPAGNAFMSVQNISSNTEAVPEKEITKSYVGQCLQAPLKKGEAYTLSFYAGRFRSWDNFTGKIFPFNVAVFGNADCNAVPFGKSNVLGNGCPSNYPGWILLGETTMYSSGEWVQGKINLAIPSDINVIEVGPDCSVLPVIADLADSTTFYDFHVYYLDDLHLLPTKDFPFYYIHTQTGIDCKGLPILVAPDFVNATYQWYKDSIAIQGATGSTYQVLDTKGISYYNVLITTADSCITAEPILITASKLDDIKIPADTMMCTNDTLLLAPAFDGITYNLNGSVSSTVRINQQGSYTIIATDLYGCERTFNTNVVQQSCSDCDAYVPSAFTPNGDGLNDLFKPKFYCFVPQFHCRIFNRWGKKIFESSDINKGWDGTYSGERLPVGTYVYYIDYKTSSGITKTVKGTIVLIL
jgi:gliding motility-associated-like protein